MSSLRIPTLTKSLVAGALFGVATLAASTALEAQPYSYNHNYENELRIRAGIFDPKAGSGYWSDSFRDFDAGSKDFQGGAFGIDFRHEIAPMLDVMFGGSYYYSQHDLAYRNFEDERGHSIFHTTRIETATADAGLVLRLAPRHSPIVPYIGGGGSAINYRLEEVGDFVDFGAHPNTIFRDRFRSQDVAWGWFALAGLDVPIGHNFAVFVEGRYQGANATLTDDFRGFGRIDLAGTYVTFGAAWRF